MYVSIYIYIYTYIYTYIYIYTYMCASVWEHPLVRRLGSEIFSRVQAIKHRSTFPSEQLDVKDNVVAHFTQKCTGFHLPAICGGAYIPPHACDARACPLARLL